MTTTPPPDGRQQPGAQPSGPPQYLAPQPLSPSDERLWATLIHVGGIFFGVVPSLVGYLVLKDRSAFVAEHAKAALNFQITLAIAYVAGSILTIVLVGFAVLLVAAVLHLVLSIVAALAANQGRPYRYPLTIAFVR